MTFRADPEHIARKLTKAGALLRAATDAHTQTSAAFQSAVKACCVQLNSPVGAKACIRLNATRSKALLSERRGV